MDNIENRKALLKQLIGAIGSNRIKGVSVTTYDASDMKSKTEPSDDELNEMDPRDMESSSVQDKADGKITSEHEMDDQDDDMLESPEEIKALLEEARAARRARK